MVPIFELKSTGINRGKLITVIRNVNNDTEYKIVIQMA